MPFASELLLWTHCDIQRWDGCQNPHQEGARAGVRWVPWIRFCDAQRKEDAITCASVPSVDAALGKCVSAALFCHASAIEAEPSYAENTVGLSQLPIAHCQAIDTATTTSPVKQYELCRSFLLLQLMLCSCRDGSTCTSLTSTQHRL